MAYFSVQNTASLSLLFRVHRVPAMRLLFADCVMDVERRELGRGPLVAVGAAHREHGGVHGVDAMIAICPLPRVFIAAKTGAAALAMPWTLTANVC